MSKTLILALLALLGVGLGTAMTISQDSQPAGDSPFSSKLEKISYTFGWRMGNDLSNNDVEIDTTIFLRGLQEGLEGKTPVITEQEMQSTLMALQQELQQKAQAKKQEQMSKNLEEGKAFLAENATKEGVQTTESGLQYKVLSEGNGPKPKLTDTVKVHYKGTLIDGRQFDSSYDRGTPATFGVGQVIKGWTEGLQLMSVGSKYMFYIPSELAYGANPRPGGIIEPNHALIFEVELLGIEGQ